MEWIVDEIVRKINAPAMTVAEIWRMSLLLKSIMILLFSSHNFDDYFTATDEYRQILDLRKSKNETLFPAPEPAQT